MSGARVLVVDDDPGILRVVRRSLEAHDYGVSAAATGAAAVAAIQSWHPEVVVLDLLLPDMSGLDVCRSVREQSDVPIIVLSALGDDTMKIEALDLGADDYLAKPFSMGELLARIRVALRRSAHLSVAPVLTAGPISMHLDSHRVTVDGVPVHLTPTEFEIGRVLLENQGKILSQRAILAAVWGEGHAQEASVLRTFVHQLRGKLAAQSATAAEIIVNEPGVGYWVATC